MNRLLEIKFTQLWKASSFSSTLNETNSYKMSNN